MNKRDHKIYLRDKENREARLERKQYADQLDTIVKDSNMRYEVAERTRAIGCGGIGAMHKLACKLGWMSQSIAICFCSSITFPTRNPITC